MALAPTIGTGTANLLLKVGQGSQKLSTQNTNLAAVGITTDAQATALNKAYSTIAGVSTNTPTLEYAAGAAIFQPLDGYTGATANQGTGLSTIALGAAQTPTGFNSNPADLSPALFNSWSSGFQRQYIDNWIQSGQYAQAMSAVSGTDYKKAGGYIEIGKNTGTTMDMIVTPSQDPAGNPIYSGGNIIVVQNLTKTSFASMDFATQTLVAKYDGTMGVSAFSPIATSLNLNTVNGVFTDPTTARTSEISAINTAIAQIVSDAKTNGVDIGYTNDTSANTSLVNSGQLFNAATGSSTGGALISATTFTGSGYTAAGNSFNDGRLLNYNDVSTFVQELLNVQKQLLNMAVFSPNDITTKISDVTTRYKYVSAFGSVPNQFSIADTGTAAKRSGTGVSNNVGLTDSEVPLRVNVVSTDTPTVNFGNGATYYLYKVQAWQSGDGPFPGGYLQQTQDDIQFFKYADFPKNTLKNAFGNIDANDYVLIDGNGNLVQLNGAFGGSGDLTITDQLNGVISTKTFSDAAGAVSPYKLDPKNNPAPFLFYQSSAGGTPPQPSDFTGTANINNIPLVGVISTTQTNSVAAGTTNQTTMQSGYGKLMQAEQQTLALQNQMASIATSGTLRNKALDVPSLIFFLQLYTNLIDEQQNSASTELVNQQNNLLNTYSQMQNLVNSVQGQFNPTTQTEQRDIFGNLRDSTVANVGYSQYTAADLLRGQSSKSTASNPIKGAPSGQSTFNILSMFDKNTGSHALNPIEKIFNIQRPTQALFDDGQGGTDKSIAYTATAWNSFGTSLSSAVTQINQQTQILLNNINTLNKEKDQHFELANNCLTKLNELLAAIGRNVN